MSRVEVSCRAISETSMGPQKSNIGRRGFLRMTGEGLIAASAGAARRNPPIRASRRIADDAIISLDCGANTHFAARNLMLRSGQRLIGAGMMASMAPGLPFAIAG
jgi:thiamine pyrophosphate-dependent acetolactate synthase large subunit-like protein